MSLIRRGAVRSGWDCFGRQFGMPSANILIRNVTAVLTADDDAAGVAMGSEMSGGIFNVTIEDCVFGTEQFASGVYIKSTNRHTSLARHGEPSI